MAATIEPPSAPAKVGSAFPASSGVIHVTPAGMSTTAFEPDPTTRQAEPVTKTVSKPADPVKKTTARQDMDAALSKKAGLEPENKVEPTVPAPEPGEEAIPVDTNAEPASNGEKTAVTDPKKGKVSPWKLVDEHKKRAAALEAEVANLKKLVPNEELRKQEMAEIETIKARAKELEDEIRFVNFSKSPEFQQKYEAPYKKAWADAMTELKEISITDPDTAIERQVSPQDILELVNLPLGKAREQADTLFGSFADDAMAHRKEIKRLFEAQATALEEARTKGAEREQEMTKKQRETYETLHKTTSEIFQRTQAELLKDATYGKLFAPVEGDDEGNRRLAKGYELVDQAFKENPMDPKLTPQQREAAVKRHLAVRNRAVAFGRQSYELQQERAKNKELLAKLSQYESTTPNISSGLKTSTTPGQLKARDAMDQALAKLAK